MPSAQQQRERQPLHEQHAHHREHSSGIPVWVAVAAALFVGALVGVAYKYGVGTERKAEYAGLHDIEVRRAFTNKRVRECEVEQTRLARGANVPKEDLDVLDALNATNRQLEDKESEVSQAASHCLQMGLDQHQQLIEKDEEHAKTRTALRQLMGQYRLLNMMVQQLQAAKPRGGGQRNVMLEQAIADARRQHFRMRAKLDMAMPERPDDSILEQYGPANGTSGTAALGALNRIAARVRKSRKPIAERIQTLIDQWTTFQYKPYTHVKVFMPETSATDLATLKFDEMRPSFFNRTMSTTVSRGIEVSRRYRPIMTTAYAVKSAFAVALCAYRKNNSRFTHPNEFYRNRRLVTNTTTTLSRLNAIIDTPLVTLCTDCESALATDEYRIACARDNIFDVYGSYDYWAARSLVRFQPEVYSAARTRWTEGSLGGKNVLTVMFKNTPQLKKRCRSIGRGLPRPHYLWVRALRANDSNPVWEASNETQKQCVPTVDDVVAAVRALSATYNYDAIFISVREERDEETLRKLDIARTIVVHRPTTAFDDAVDVVLASWGTHVLANRFSDTSQLIVEAHALRNGITAQGVHYF